MRIHRVAVPVTVGVLVLDAALLATGTIGLPTAVLLILLVELPLGIVSIASLITGIRTSGLRATLLELPGGPLIVAELSAVRTLWRAVRGMRVGEGSGVRAFPATQGARTLPIVVVALTVLELGAVRFLVPWVWLELLLAVLALYGALMIAAYTAGRWVYPHLLSDDALTVRFGRDALAVIPLTSIAAGTVRERGVASGPEFDRDRDHLHAATSVGTQLDLELSAPVEATLPALRPSKRQQWSITSLSLAVDDADGLAAAVAKKSAEA